MVDLLGHLVDKSLVVVQPPAPGTGGEVRYRLLETLRQYARERLAAEDAPAAAARRHARYFLDLVERADARLWAGDEPGAMGRIAPEHDNVRAALRHLLATGEAEGAARLAGALGMFWFFRATSRRGGPGCARCWPARARPGPRGARARPTRRRCTPTGGWPTARATTPRPSSASTPRSLSGAGWGTASRRPTPCSCSGARSCCGAERAAARPLFLESLACAEAAGDPWMESLTRLWLAQVAFDEGDDAAARAGAEQVLAGAAAFGSRRNASFALRLLGDVAARRGDAARARTLLEASLAQGREVGRWLAAWPAVNLADLLTEQHDHAGARALLGEALRTYRDAGDRQGVARSLEGCARLAAAAGPAAQAVRLAGAAAALREAAGAPLPPPERLTLDRHLAAARRRSGRAPPARLGGGPGAVERAGHH